MLVSVELGVGDIVEAIEALSDAQVYELALQLPDRVIDAAVALMQPVQLVLDDDPSIEAGDLYPDDVHVGQWLTIEIPPKP